MNIEFNLDSFFSGQQCVRFRTEECFEEFKKCVFKNKPGMRNRDAWAHTYFNEMDGYSVYYSTAMFRTTDEEHLSKYEKVWGEDLMICEDLGEIQNDSNVLDLFG